MKEDSKPATFDEVWYHLRPFMPDDFTTQQAIIVMDKFGWIDNGPCTCGLEVYDDPCTHHSRELSPLTKQLSQQQQTQTKEPNNEPRN